MTDVGLCSEKERWLNEVPKDQADELWPPPLWPGHFCRRSFLQLRDSSGLSAQQPPYSFAVRYDLRPLSKQMSGVSAYLMLMDGESLRRIGKGSGLDLVAAAKSWIARHALCAPPQLLARDADGKLTGEVVAQPDPHLYGNGEGVLLMSVVLTADLKDWRDWRPVGDLMSYRLGSPPVQCGLCGMAVAQRDLLAHQKECLEVMIPCPRCGKRVLIRELSAHQKGRDCLSQLVMSTQTEDLETEDVGSQCVTPALLPVAVQTSYASALLAPSIRAEEAVPALVPSLAIRWQAPPSQVRQMLTEYQLTVSEFMGGDERWKHLRVELLDIERLEKLSGLSNGELRHELTNLRPGTKYRLELQLRAVDGCLGPKAQVTLHTLSRLAGFEGLSEDERLHLASAMVPEGPAQRPESLSVREQATQAGPGFVTGACKSEISREVGVQAFPKIFTETACQIDPLVAIQKDTASGPEWPLLSHCAVQCKAGSRESSSQCEVKLSDCSCQAQFPARPYTGDQKAELEMDLQSGVPGWREVLQQTGFSQLLRLLLVVMGNATALAGILLADLVPQEMWPMLASLIVLLPFNALELLFFQTFPPSRRSSTKLRIWRRRHPNTNMLIQAAVVTISPDALHFYRAPMQPGGRRFTGVVGPQPESPVRKVPGTTELCAAKCPMCSQLSPIPRMGDLWRSSRFLLYCHLPQLVLAILLLLRRIDLGLVSELDVGRVALHGFTVLAHGICILWIVGHWLQYRFRRKSQKLKVSDLIADLDVVTQSLRLTWSGMEEVLCEAWFVVFHSFDRKNILRIEMLPGRPEPLEESSGLRLEGIPPGHFWVSVLSYHRSAGLSMPLAMGHCEIPVDGEELKRRCADSGVDAQTETIWEVKDVGTDPLHIVRAMADAEVQNVAASVDAVAQWPAVPVERVDASTMPCQSTSSETRHCATASAVGCFDLPVVLKLEDHSEPSAPESARGLWLNWDPHGLQELAPRLVARARHVSGAGLVDGAMGVSRASFQLEVGRYELLLSCELGLGQAEVRACPHQRCQQRFWSHHLEAHLSRCPWQPRPCPRASKGCQWMGCSDELESHELECVGMEVECKNQHLGCKWVPYPLEESRCRINAEHEVGPASLEAAHLQECPAEGLLEVVQPLEKLLSEACPDFRNPETARLVQQCLQYRRYVRPCGQWKEWKSSGRCCECSKIIDRKEKGLQCETPSSRLCWSCMPSRMDWQRLKDEGKIVKPSQD